MSEDYGTSKMEKAINDVVTYFYNNHKQFYATAIQNAQGRVRLFESCGHPYREYRQSINRGLCEALFFMNSDPECNPTNIRFVRQLLESYRNMNGLSTDDFATDMGEDLVADVRKGVTFEETINDDSIREFICANTEIGEEYLVEEIIDSVKEEFFPDASFMDNFTIVENIMSEIKLLVKCEIFEVSEREDINGSIYALIRLK